MNIYSYILMHDTGFAPCIQNNLLTLGCCKPVIRRSAKIGDYIVAFYGKAQEDKRFSHALAYIAKVTKVMTYKQYFIHHKNRTDCIYDEKLKQLPNDYHDTEHKKRDLSGFNVLLSTDFIFFGNSLKYIDEKYLSMIAGRGHKVRHNEKFKKSFPKHFKELKKKHGNGLLGEHIHPEKGIMHETKPTKRKRTSSRKINKRKKSQ